MVRKGREAVSPNSHPWHGNLLLGRVPTNIELLSEEQGFFALYQAPSPWDLYWRDKPSPKYLALKTSGAYTEENHRTVGNGDSILEVLICRFTHSTTQHKSAV